LTGTTLRAKITVGRHFRGRMTMRRRSLVVCSILIVASSLASRATGGASPDLPKSATIILNLKPGLTYQASLFVPPVRITIPVAGWKGSQHVSHGYDWFFLGWRDRGGMAVISAPGSRQSAATTLHRLETERADTPAVGITRQPPAAIKIAGFPGQQFEGVVTGQYGHTFAPFSTSKGGSSTSAGDHLRYAKNVAFRIVVLNVRGKPIVFLMDSNKPTLDPTFLAANAKLLKLLRFVSA
jgi:hypothetical protein